ncbi:sel1 repeat family protein [Paludibacter sp. 221]|uniref:tetratricopeptide repeat protein n=1 Tax=Paludibacter sp. 221 TaxID=2302939 RepID=UPI0013D28C59|nr:tetratricopeptide repeat protein [Paludibacter sp. 221]NDV45992.1 sel1 repeat family protein [Paludibacter sp. 221]
MTELSIQELYLKGMELLNSPEPNISEGLQYLNEAAEKGSLEAQNQLGYFYEKGEFVEKNRKKAIEFYKKSADGGYNVAQTNLALLYLNGDEDKERKRQNKKIKLRSTKEPVKAAYYATLSANQGNMYGQSILGYMYLNGIGVKKNLKKALDWSRIAAGQGEDDALYNVKYIEENYNLNGNREIEKPYFKRSIIATILLFLSIIVSGYFIVTNIIDTIDIIDGYSRYEITFISYIKNIVLTAICLSNIIAAVMILMWKESGIKFLFVSMLSSLLLLLVTWLLTIITVNMELYSFAYGILMNFIAYGITLLSLFINNKAGLSIFYYLGQNSEYNEFLFEFGYGNDFMPGSEASKKFASKKKTAMIVMVVVAVAYAALALFRGSLNFNMNPNYFQSWMAVPLFIVGFFLMLREKTSSYQSYNVYEDGFGNKKYERNDDVIESMTGGIIMPLLQRFVIFPLVAALMIYYGLFLLLAIIEGIFPLFMAVVFIFSLIYCNRALVNAQHKLNRQKLIPFTLAGLILIYTVVLLFIIS